MEYRELLAVKALLLGLVVAAGVHIGQNQGWKCRSQLGLCGTLVVLLHNFDF